MCSLAEVPHMPTKSEILERAKELFFKERPEAPTPEEEELKEGNYLERARLDIMTGVRSELERYLAYLESEEEKVREELGIEKPLPAEERIREVEDKLSTLEVRYKTTRERLAEAREEIKKMKAPPPIAPPPPPVKIPPVRRPLKDFPEQMKVLRERLEREMRSQFLREGLSEEEWFANRGTVIRIIRESIALYAEEEKEKAEPKILERVDRVVNELIKKIKVRPPPPVVIPPVMVPPAVEIVPVRRAEPLQKQEIKGIEEILGMPYSKAIDKFQTAIAENRTEEIAKWRELFKRAKEETRALYKTKGKRWIS